MSDEFEKWFKDYHWAGCRSRKDTDTAIKLGEDAYNAALAAQREPQGDTCHAEPKHPCRFLCCEGCGEFPLSVDSGNGHCVTVTKTDARGDPYPEMDRCGPITCLACRFADDAKRTLLDRMAKQGDALAELYLAHGEDAAAIRKGVKGGRQ